MENQNCFKSEYKDKKSQVKMVFYHVVFGYYHFIVTAAL